MFGGNQRPESERYAQGREWISVVRQLWASQDLVDFEGKYYSIRGARCTPRLYQGTEPILMNAGRSAEGRQFAVEIVDCLFTSVRSPDDAKALVAEIRERARALGREVDVYTTGYVVCRPTRREAEEYLHYYAVENRDEEAMAHRGRLRNEDAESLAAWAAGHHGWPLIGNPDDVAQGLAQIAATGIAGVAIGLVNYLNELPYFCQEVLPRLQRMGIR